jgi:hypothetical protein
LEAQILVDCTGFGVLSNTPDALLRQLSGPAGMLSANTTDRSFVLEPTFEAYPNLFVLGPLMTGFSDRDTHIWHLENIPRIRELAGRVGSLVAERLSRDF